MSKLVDPPYVNKEKGEHVIVLEDGGHRLLVKRSKDSWALKVDHVEGPTSRETAWATIKKAEGLRTSHNAKQIRESYGVIFGAKDVSKMIDDTIGILQSQHFLWPIPEEGPDTAPSKVPTQAEALFGLVLSSGSTVFLDQNDDGYIIFNLQKFPSDASVAGVAVLDNPILRDHTLFSPLSSVYNRDIGSGKTASLATLATPAHLRYHRLKSNKVKEILSLMMHTSFNEVAGTDALKSTVTLLSGYAQNQPKIKLYNRMGVQLDGSWWLDLTDEAWRAIKITEDHWEMVNDPPIMFKRYSHQLPILEPKPGGSVLDILDFTNFVGADERGDFEGLDEQLLYMVFNVLEVLIPEIPHVVPYIYGGPGTVKSTSQVVVMAIFDNSSMVKGLLNMPHDPNKLGQILDHHYLAYFDNVSNISEDQSDLLCRAVTGAAISNRLLYSDDDDFIRQFMRCVSINGVNVVARKPDLLDRVGLLETKKVSKTDRKEDAVIMKIIYEKAPMILYDALDTVVRARQVMRDNVSVDGGLSRMADAERWGVALTEALGIEREKFLVAYRNNIVTREADSIKSSVVGELLIALLERRLPPWKKDVNGWIKPKVTDMSFAPSELFIALQELAAAAGINVRNDFPPDSARLSGEINEFAPNLPSVGFRLIKRRTGGGGRKMIFTRLIPTKLDEAMNIQRVENNWLGCRDLREYVKKRRGAAPEVVEIKSEVVLEVKEEVNPDMKEEVKHTLFELMRETVELMLGMGDILIKDETLFEMMEAKFGIQRAKTVKIISALMRDGTIYAPRPGFYKVTGA